jgi:hypothetical protein
LSLFHFARFNHRLGLAHRQTVRTKTSPCKVKPTTQIWYHNAHKSAFPSKTPIKMDRKIASANSTFNARWAGIAKNRTAILYPQSLASFLSLKIKSLLNRKMSFSLE